MLKKYSLKNLLIQILTTICALLILCKSSYSQPFEALLNKILLQDESINSSKTLIKKNKNDLSSAWSLYTPKLDINIPLGREVLINNNNANTDMDYYELDAKISQNIFDFGATKSKIDIAKNQVELSKISSENVKSVKILEALSAYLNYMKTFNILKYAKESEDRIINVTRLENEKVARGAGLASNVLQSKARLAGARSIRVKFEGDLSIAKNRFFNVFREDPLDFKTFEVPILPIQLLPESQEAAINIAKKNNIALKISNIDLKNSKSKIKGSKAKFLPSLKAIAQYKNKRNASGLEGTEIDHTYKLEMSYPISIGGPYGLFYKENADYKSSLNQYMISKYGHDQLERNLEESVRNSWQTKSIAKQNYEYLENQANISGEFFDLAMKEVKLGNRQLIDILSSETAFINAKSAAENAKTEYQLAVYQLLFAVGILNEKIFSNDKVKFLNNKKKLAKEKNPKEKTLNTNNTKINFSSLDNKKIKKNNFITKKSTKKNVILSKEKNKNDYNEKTLLKEQSKSLKPIKLLGENNKTILDNKNNSSNKSLSMLEKNTKIDKKQDLIKIKEKKYKIQLGAFSSYSNADRFLNQLVSSSEGKVKLFIEEDPYNGLFKIKSNKSFDKNSGKSLCADYQKIDINCILSRI